MLAGIPAVDQCEQGLPPAMRSRCNKAAHTQAPLTAARELQGYTRTLGTAGFEAHLDAHRCVTLDREAVDESENASVATRAANADRLASRPPHNLRPRFSRQGLPRRDLLSNFLDDRQLSSPMECSPLAHMHCAHLSARLSSCLCLSATMGGKSSKSSNHPDVDAAVASGGDTHTTRTPRVVIGADESKLDAGDHRGTCRFAPRRATLLSAI